MTNPGNERQPRSFTERMLRCMTAATAATASLCAMCLTVFKTVQAFQGDETVDNAVFSIIMTFVAVAGVVLLGRLVND